MHLGCATGNTAAALDRYLPVPGFTTILTAMDFAITGVGTEIYYRSGQGFDEHEEWPYVRDWDAAQVHKTLIDRPELHLQGALSQTPYKVSFEVRAHSELHYPETIRQLLGQAGIMAQVIFSSNTFLDLLPLGIHKGAAVKRVAKDLFDHERPKLVVAGDSMNDREMLSIADIAILPANANAELKQWAAQTLQPHRLYFARRPVAAGVLEGLFNTGVFR